MNKIKVGMVRRLCLSVVALLFGLPVPGQTPEPAASPEGQTPNASTRQTAPPDGQTPGPALRPAAPPQGAANTPGAGSSPQTSSSQFIAPSGLGVRQLVDAAFQRRADLIAARQRLAIAQGALVQAGLRPNPQLSTQYGSARFLGGDPEYDLSAGVTQLFETGGKRGKRIAVARLELAQATAEVGALERQAAADIRADYARALAAGRQLDTLERLIRAGEEQVRITNVRLNAGDVAPLDLNLVRIETDRLRAQAIGKRADLEAEIISLRALIGFNMTEPLRIAPVPDRPPRLELSLAELTEIALRERPDLQAARLGERLGTARIRLARSQATPDVSGSVTYSRTRRVTELPEALGVGPARQTENSLVFGVTVDLPIFNRNQGQIASAVGEREQARAQAQFLEATIRRDVALAYSRYRAAAATLVLYTNQIIPRSEANVRAVRGAYSEGEFSVFDIVNEQRRLIDNQTSANDALRDYYTALADLERALGTTIPPAGFAPGPISVLPDDAPHIDPGELRRSLVSSQAPANPPAPGAEEVPAPETLASPRPSPSGMTKVDLKSQQTAP